MKIDIRILIMVLTISMIVTACKPSEANIQKAIAHTQTAQPTVTNTSTPLPAETPTKTLTPTSTSAPTKTSTSTPTKVEILELRQMAITKQDLGDILVGYYKTDIIELDIDADNDAIINSYSGFFMGEAGAGNIALMLNQFTSNEVCIQYTNELPSMMGGRMLELPNVKLPEKTVIFEEEDDDKVILILCQSSVMATIWFDIPATLTAEDVVVAVSMIGQKQNYKIQDSIGN